MAKIGSKDGHLQANGWFSDWLILTVLTLNRTTLKRIDVRKCSQLERISFPERAFLLAHQYRAVRLLVGRPGDFLVMFPRKISSNPFELLRCFETNDRLDDIHIFIEEYHGWEA